MTHDCLFPVFSPTERGMKDHIWHVYLLICADASLYCGICGVVARWLRQHNGELAGGARYTRTRRPVRLAACAVCSDHGSALRLERLIKKLPKEKKLDALLRLAKEGGER